MPVQFQTNKASYVINITPEFPVREKFSMGEKEREREGGGARELQEIKHAGAAIRRAIRPALNPPSFFYHFALGDEGGIRGKGKRRVEQRHDFMRAANRSTNLQTPFVVASKSTVFNVDDNLLLRPVHRNLRHVLQFATLPRKLCAIPVSPVVVRFPPAQRSPPPRV